MGSHKQSRDGCGSQSHSNHHTSNEAQNLRKLTTVPRLDADPQQKTSFPVGAGVLSLMPPASVSANPHPAFFTSGVPGHVMSYGDYLRSMSRPYSMSSGLPVAGNHFVPDLYRAQPQPPSILPGMFGASPYPLSYFGYPSYFPATAVPDSKGGNPALGFQTQLPAFRGLSTRIESERENYLEKENSNNEEEEEEEEEENIPRPKMHTTEDTEDEISVDERENRDEPDEVTDGSRTEEDVRPNPVQQNVSGESEVRTEAGLVGLFGEKDGKEDVKVDEPRVVENDSNVDNEDEKEDGHEERRDEKGLDAGGHVPQHEVRFSCCCCFNNDHPAVQLTTKRSLTKKKITKKKSKKDISSSNLVFYAQSTITVNIRTKEHQSKSKASKLIIINRYIGEKKK